jgi:NADH:ubiquinone oxidoreductase subunit D
MLTKRAFETVEMPINVGPQHPSTHGVLRLVMTLDGEQIVKVEPVIGYLYRAVEKLCENLRYQNIPHLFDRLDYVSAFNNELPLAMAEERLLGLQVPARGEYLRVILCELNRIASHFLFFGAFGHDAGTTTSWMYGFRERERIQHLFEMVSGYRMMHDFIVPGGVREDVPEEFLPALRELLPVLWKGLEDCHNLLTENEVLNSRTRGIGVIGGEEAINYGLSGPSLRASGVPEDIRRAEPYSVYPELEFEVPVGQNGDAYDRYWVRMQEVAQSVRIVEQALDRLPDGPVCAPGLPKYPKVLKLPEGEVYARAENPRGEFGVYLISTGGDRPYRLKIRAPSFCNLMALPRLMEGHYLADAIMVLGSLDVVMGEVDR